MLDIIAAQRIQLLAAEELEAAVRQQDAGRPKARKNVTGTKSALRGESFVAVTIRNANATDAAIVALLGRLTFQETFSPLFVEHQDELLRYLDWTFAPAKIAASIGKVDNRCWIAFIDGLPVGYAKLKLSSRSSDLEASAPAQLQKIYVLSEFASRHVGRALMHEIRTEAERLNINKIWLNVLSTNERAIHFYERRGWTRAGEATFDIGSQSFHFLTLRTS